MAQRRKTQAAKQQRSNGVRSSPEIDGACKKLRARADRLLRDLKAQQKRARDVGYWTKVSELDHVIKQIGEVTYLID